MMSLKDTKRRINGVKNTQKITRAMKMVSSAKFARAIHAFTYSQPYRTSFASVLSRLLQREEITHPLLTVREEKKNLCIVLATDRGFCGGLNSNLLKFSAAFLRDKKEQTCTVELWGKKAKPFEKVGLATVASRVEKVLERPSYEFCLSTIQRLSRAYEAGEIDGAYILYPSFKNAVVQEPAVKRFFPFLREDLPVEKVETRSTGLILEPDAVSLFPSMVEKYLAVQLYQILLESAVSEHASRMAAMDNATNNADEVIQKLTLNYNRARQAAITKELIEITSGAEAL